MRILQENRDFLQLRLKIEGFQNTECFAAVLSEQLCIISSIQLREETKASSIPYLDLQCFRAALYLQYLQSQQLNCK